MLIVAKIVVCALELLSLSDGGHTKHELESGLSGMQSVMDFYKSQIYINLLKL